MTEQVEGTRKRDRPKISLLDSITMWHGPSGFDLLRPILKRKHWRSLNQFAQPAAT